MNKQPIKNKDCVKVAFESKEVANDAIMKFAKEKNFDYPQTSYLCSNCGSYHLTSQNNENNDLLKMYVDKIKGMGATIDKKIEHIKQLEKRIRELNQMLGILSCHSGKKRKRKPKNID